MTYSILGALQGDKCAYGRWDHFLSSLSSPASCCFLPQSEKSQESSCWCSVAVALSKCRSSYFRSSFQGSWRPSLSLRVSHLQSVGTSIVSICCFCVRPLLCSLVSGESPSPSHSQGDSAWLSPSGSTYDPEELMDALPIHFLPFSPQPSQSSCSTTYFFRLFRCELDSSSCILQTPRNRCQTQHGFPEVS